MGRGVRTQFYKDRMLSTLTVLLYLALFSRLWFKPICVFQMRLRFNMEGRLLHICLLQSALCGMMYAGLGRHLV